jgi:predicted O-linked N-acetylglucosamine transferase (SPINDLY family)
MHEGSIVLANQRLAPIQISSYGHSVSSFGAEIDYFVCSEEVEDLGSINKNYSERPVIIPGAGIINLSSSYRRVGAKNSDQTLLIACPWSAQKTNYPLVQTLKKLKDSVQEPIRFRFLTGPLVLRNHGHLVFRDTLVKALGEDSIELIPGADYPEYMRLIEECDLALDSFHFAGCNCVLDCLLAAVPMVVRQGTKWYNRIGTWEMKAAGLHELCAENEEQFLTIAQRLISDKGWREMLKQRIAATDLHSTALFDTSPAEAFCRAIEEIDATHEQLFISGEKSPIYFRAR